MTMPTSQDNLARFLTTAQIRQLWGNCSHMTIERKLRSDPNFPKAMRLGRIRLFRLEDIESYERSKIVGSNPV